VPLLAGSIDLLELPPPPTSWLLELDPLLSTNAKMNIWHSLSYRTRTGYKSARSSFEFFCKNRGIYAFLVQKRPLIEWVTLRAIGSPDSEPYQDRVFADTIMAYCFALRSVHVDRGLLLDVFQDETVRRVLASIR
jgi:hypothetical protein